MTSNLNRSIKDLYENPQIVEGNKEEDVMDNSTETPDEKIVTQVVSLEKDDSSFIKKSKIKFSEFFKNNKSNLKYLLLIIPIIAILVIAKVIENNQSLGLQAATHQASFSFQLSSWTLPPQNTFGVWINSDSPIGYADVELSFNPSLVKMTKEVAIKDKLTRKINITSMSEANTTGKISILVGLDPANKSNAPSGVFQIADVTFDANTTNPNILTSINYLIPSMQVVSTDQSTMSLIAAGIDLTVNPATPKPTIVPTTTPTLTPTPTITPKPTTPTPKPTQATPTPTVVPTSVPSIPPQQNLLLTGTVRSSGSNSKLLSGARITVKNSLRKKVASVTTDKNGYFGFRLPSGIYTLSASKFGYFDSTQTVNLTGNTIVSFQLSSWWRNWRWH
jgi:hypothetical protein